jgi:hypothetical protein
MHKASLAAKKWSCQKAISRILMHAAGFRVLEVSGGYQMRGRFFGNQSRHIIVLAERKENPGT